MTTGVPGKSSKPNMHWAVHTHGGGTCAHIFAIIDFFIDFFFSDDLAISKCSKNVDESNYCKKLCWNFINLY